ncbi:hypothetical protein [Blastopirellula marina]|uniref:Uncharacterized protein n=1 Tax=Blastopirellula marina DSM 3645 TaxID=314230 RepID=A3ZRP3_9BACT|nr:hypothetical protein [Blastopirellula marina]EAQ80812.1 hypothetical protein DSM3645_12366 [Blastopirellula marina DSM 3645]
MAAELSRAEATRFDYALSRYERRQRQRVERGQANSPTRAFAREWMMSQTRLDKVLELR